MDTENDGGR